MRRPSSTFQHLQVPTRKPEGDSVSGAVVREGVMGTNSKRGNLGWILGRIFTVRVLRHWNRLPQDTAGAPTLAVVRARVDETLSNLV